MEHFCFVKAVGTVFISWGITKIKYLDTYQIVDELARKICKDLGISFVR